MTLNSCNELMRMLKQGYVIDENDIEMGLKNAHIPFRFEIVPFAVNKDGERRELTIILDGAHNEDGARKLVDSLKHEFPGKEYIFVTGIFKDKDYDKIAEIISEVASEVIVTENDLSDRALSKQILTETYKKYINRVSQYDKIEMCIERGIEKANNTQNAILIFSGSLSWLNRAKEYIQKFGGKE